MRSVVRACGVCSTCFNEIAELVRVSLVELEL